MQYRLEYADLALVLVPPEPEACATLARLRLALQEAGVPAVFAATRVQAARQLHADVLALLRATLGDAMLPYQVHLDVGLPDHLADAVIVLLDERGKLFGAHARCRIHALLNESFP